MQTINYTEFRANLKYWLDKVIDDMNDLIITRKNGKDLVLVPLEEYNALKETTYLLSGKNGEVLLESIQQAKDGKITERDLIEE